MQATTERIRATTDKASPIVPGGDRLVVRRIESAEMKGGIIIPDNAKERAAYAVVAEVGPLVKNPNLVKDALIAMGKYAGTDISIFGDELVVLREEEVIGVLADRDVIKRLVYEGA